MTSPAASTTSPLQPLRMIVISFASTIPMLAVVMIVVAGLEEDPSPVVAGVLFLLNVLAFGLAELIGYRTPAIPRDASREQARRTGLTALQTTTMLRLAITEAPALLSLVAVFVLVPTTAWTYLVGALWALVSVVWHGWPSARVIRRTEASLDREGGRSHLSEAVAEPLRPSGTQRS